MSLLLDLRHALFKAALQASARFRASPELRRALGLTRLLLQLQLFGTVIPVADLLGQAVLDGGFRLFKEFELALANLGDVFGDDMGDGVALRLLLESRPIQELSGRDRIASRSGSSAARGR